MCELLHDSIMLSFWLFLLLSQNHVDGDSLAIKLYFPINFFLNRLEPALASLDIEALASFLDIVLHFQLFHLLLQILNLFPILV